MWKIILLIILILGCDKMATEYTGYTKTDPNPDGIIDAIDMDRKGLIRLSLTEWSTTAKPNVAQESIVENGGTGFKTDTTGGDPISLTDPTTGTTVVDGPVYIVLNGDSGSGGYGTYAFTATDPTWSDEKQGYYLTGLYSDYRAVGGCQLVSGVYNDKYVQVGRDHRIYYNNQQEFTEYIATEKTTTSTSPVDITPSFSGNIDVLQGDIIEVSTSISLKNTTSLSTIYYLLEPIGTCSFVTYDIGSGDVVSRENDLDSLFRWASTTYLKAFFPKKIQITVGGTLKFKEKFYVNSGTGYAKERAIYFKKTNNIKIGL